MSFPVNLLKFWSFKETESIEYGNLCFHFNLESDYSRIENEENYYFQIIYVISERIKLIIFNEKNIIRNHTGVYKELCNQHNYLSDTIKFVPAMIY